MLSGKLRSSQITLTCWKIHQASLTTESIRQPARYDAAEESLCLNARFGANFSTKRMQDTVEFRLGIERPRERLHT